MTALCLIVFYTSYSACFFLTTFFFFNFDSITWTRFASLSSLSFMCFEYCVKRKKIPVSEVFVVAKYSKVGAGWMGKTGIISFRSQDESIVIPSKSKLVLFPVKDKKSDNHPDFDLCLVKEVD